MGDNGFDEHKLLYEERFRLNEIQHEAMLASLAELNRKVDNIEKGMVKHAAWWGMVGAIAVLAVNFVMPMVLSGCQ